MNLSRAALPSRVVCRGAVRVPLPPERALPLFTPRGERGWAVGWDPLFPADDADDTAPGTVFVTNSHDGRHAIWIVADRGELSMRYARAIPGVSAGTVDVRCERAGSGTVTDVTYDITALHEDERPRLGEFAAAYEAFLGDWERQIAAALRREC
jgi:hypothetical protein